MIAFINHEGTGCKAHRDYPPETGSKRDQFLWINIDGRKQFYILDDAGEKHLLQGSVNTFDNANVHGSFASPFASWSLRIDGIFSPAFLTLTGLADHFK